MKRACLDCGQPTEGSRCRACDRSLRNAAYGGDYRRRRATLIGQPCELALPGCTGIANTADHEIPKVLGRGAGRLRPACANCNFALKARNAEKFQTCTGREKGGEVAETPDGDRRDPSPPSYRGPIRSPQA